MKAAITSALSNQWLQNCMDLVHESYAINFMDPEASVRNMEVKFENDPGSSTLAYVTNTYDSGTGKTNKLTLTVNMSYYNNIDMKDPNGYDKTSRQPLHRFKVCDSKTVNCVMERDERRKRDNFVTAGRAFSDGAAQSFSTTSAKS